SLSQNPILLATTRLGESRSMTRRQLHRLHKWIAVSAGIFFLSWMISGIVMILPGGKLGRTMVRPLYESATVSPAQIASIVGDSIADMTLIRIAGRVVYQVQTPRGPRLIDAHSGTPFPITSDVAEQIVRSEYVRDGAVLEKSLLERHNWTYQMGPLPVY